MGLYDILTMLLTGAVVGWIAGLLVRNRGGLVRNVICGVLGGFVGGYLSDWIHYRFEPGWLCTGVYSVAGAVVVILVFRILGRIIKGR